MFPPRRITPPRPRTALRCYYDSTTASTPPDPTYPEQYQGNESLMVRFVNRIAKGCAITITSLLSGFMVRAMSITDGVMVDSGFSLL